MDEFRDSDISSLLNQFAGSSPDTMAAHSAVLGKVRRVRQRRMATVGAAAVVMVVSGAVAIVQNSQNRDGGLNIAVPLSPDDSEPIGVSTTIDNQATINTQTTTIPADVQVPITPQGPSVTTEPMNTPVTSTTIETPEVSVPNSIPSTNTPSSSPETTRPPTTTRPPSTTAPSPQVPTSPPVTTPDIKTWTCRGGSVKYQMTSSGLVLLESKPAVGFRISESQARGNEITMKFVPDVKNDERKSVIKIKNSRIVSTSCDDEGFDRRSDSEVSDSNDNNDESADD
jgi:hypothetical protein